MRSSRTCRRWLTALNSRGYKTAYAVSRADREAVISDLPWKEVLLLPNSEVDALRKKLLCVTVYEFEYGCEDRAILPKVFRLSPWRAMRERAPGGSDHGH